MKYDKIIKWVLSLLFVVGIVLSAYGFIVGWPKTGNGMPPLSEQNCAPVDVILWGAYIFAGATIASVLFGIFVIGGINNPKSLIKLLLGVVAIVAIVGGAWLLAKGEPAIGYMEDPNNPLKGWEYKVTDMMLILTYASFIAAVVSLIIGWLVGATRK